MNLPRAWIAIQAMAHASRITFRASRFAHHVSRFTLHGLWFLAALLATAWAPIPQEGEIAVVGQVTNGTPGGAVPSGLPITLHVSSGTEEMRTYTTSLAADGSFRFDGLALDGEETLIARLVYRDVIYVSDPVTFEPGQQEPALPVTIYETTEAPTFIRVTQLHVFVTRDGDCLQMGEYYLVSNTGDRTYVGVEDAETGQRATLTFTLPEGAEGLLFDGPGLGERFLEREEGFSDTEPVLPGTATVEVFFGYRLPYREGLHVERVFGTPVDSVVLVLSGEGMALEGAGLTLEGSLDTQMGPALSYIAGPLAAGEPLTFTLVAEPVGEQESGGAEEQRDSGARETAIGLATLAVAVVAVYLLWLPPAPVSLPARARPLVEAIAALDVDFEMGRVREKTYRQKRQTLKQRLCVLLSGGGEAREQRGRRARERRK
jgi:hypothetical protein